MGAGVQAIGSLFSCCTEEWIVGVCQRAHRYLGILISPAQEFQRYCSLCKNIHPKTKMKPEIHIDSESEEKPFIRVFHVAEKNGWFW